jgi:hypothetical protein
LKLRGEQGEAVWRRWCARGVRCGGHAQGAQRSHLGDGSIG